MKNKYAKILIVLAMAMILIMSDFVMLGKGIAIAIYEELDNQNNASNIKNIFFDAYFINNGKNSHYIEGNISQEQTLFLNINVKEQGVLKDAKINIENANFEILSDKVKNEYVKNINSDISQIELNEIVYEKNVIIELPIKFKKQELITNDYFDKENTISINGTYKDDREESVFGNIITRISWKQETDVNMNQKIEKYINLGEDGILLQQNITTQVVDNILPRENENLTLQVPVLDEQIPEDVVILLNGNKLLGDKFSYDKKSKIIQINNESKGIWGTAENTYKIIYKYNNVSYSNATIDLKTEMKTKLYTQSEIDKQDTNTVEIKEMGTVVNNNKIVTENIYKGFMYAGTQDETIFSESHYLEISDINSIDSISIEKGKEQFANNDGYLYTLQNKVLYKSTTINKEEFTKILGENGNITIKDLYGTVITNVNKESPVNEDGNIIVNYNEGTNYIVITTSKPISEGILTINNTRSIKGSDTGYNKKQLKNFTNLNMQTKLKTNLQEELTESNIKLEETKTEAKIEISNNQLSTLQTNENVQFLVTLRSDSEQYDLYKNPYIEIILPQNVGVNVKNILQLNGQEELKITNAKQYKNANAQQVIGIQIEGEQTSFENTINEGIQISITADITIDKTISSKSAEICMNYTNENKDGELFSTAINVNLNSKYGILTINEFSNYNKNGDTVEIIDNEEKVGKLDTLSEERDAKENIYIINNYEYDITDVAIIGKIPDLGEETIDDKELKATFAMNLKQPITVNQDLARVYYSEDANANKDSQTWKEEIPDLSAAKSFKIELADNKISSGQVIQVSYDLGIPANLKESESTYNNLTLDYNFSGVPMNLNSTMSLKTNETEKEQEESMIVSSQNELSIELSAISENKVLENGQDVKEGQKIKYNLKLTNNTNKDMTNINIGAVHTNAIYWNHVKEEVLNSITGKIETVSKYQEDTSLNKYETVIDNLPSGQSINLDYQISVKEVEDNDQTLSGQIKISADGMEEKQLDLNQSKIVESKLSLVLKDSFYEQTQLYSNQGFPIELCVKNTTDKNLNNIIVELPLPKEVYFSLENFSESDNVKFIEYTNKVAKFEILNINAQETVSIYTQLMIEKIALDTLYVNTNFSFNARVDDETYYSNEIERKLEQSETEITANQTASKEDKYLKDGEEIVFTTTIENKGAIAKTLNITDNVPKNIIVLILAKKLKQIKL